MQSEKTDQLALALSKVQASLRPALRTSTNPFFHSKYAPLDVVWDACRSQLGAARIRGNPAIGKPWRPTEDLVSRRSKRHLVSVIIQVDDRGGSWLGSGGLLATPLTISIQSFAEVDAVGVLGFRLEVLDIPLD